jgi:uncharacterized membrane-anchored protein
MTTVSRALAAWALILAAASSALAQAPAPDPRKQALDDARQASTAGPADVPLASKAVLKLPANHAFVPQPQAGKLLHAMGNPGQDPRLLGLIFPSGDAGWFMTVRFEDSGHIKDDDAKDWNADDLLKQYREGTESTNAERVKMGVPAIEIVGWAEQPAYDAATHRLVWAMSSREKGAAATDGQGVNYNTYVLGRDGYFMLNLVTDLKDLPAHKPAAHTMLSALNFNEGQRYADFNPSTDRVAEYGLAALVVGTAAKKLGFLAAAGLFFAKFAKVILLGLAGLGALATKLFKRKGTAATPPTA